MIERRRPGLSFDPVVLPDGVDWMLRPPIRGMCKFESLKDGTVDLCDIALMNEGLDAEEENQYRAQEAARQP